jgi:hypothetical protein
MLRARDAMDRDYAKALDIPALARIASVSEAHFIRTFRATFGETPHRYLQRRRIERAMFLLRETDRSVTEIRPSSSGEARARPGDSPGPHATRSLIHRSTCSIRTRRSTSTSASSGSS